jgi:Leucine-rich repeat (LRR) protein
MVNLVRPQVNILPDYSARQRPSTFSILQYRVVTLVFRYYNLNSMKFAVYLKQLEHLHLSKNQIEVIPVEIDHMKSL